MITTFGNWDLHFYTESPSQSPANRVLMRIFSSAQFICNWFII